MIKFIHTADLHLGLQFNNVSFDKDKALSRRRELWSTFDRIVKKSNDEKIDFLLIAGDLFEASYFTMGDMKRIKDSFKNCPDVNILISAGNHDFKDGKSLYDRVEWSSNVTIFNSGSIDKKVFLDLNTVVYGYSWDRMEMKENLLLEDFSFEENMNSILLIHGDIGTKSNYLPLDLNNLKALHMDYIALGHIHKPNILADNIAYSGSPEPLDFGELGDRGIIVGQIDNNGTKIEFQPFSKRNFYSLDVNLDGEMGYLDIVGDIKNIDCGFKDVDFYRLNLNGLIQSDIDVDNLYWDLKDYFYHIEIVDNTTLDYDLEELEKANSDNVIGQFISAMRLKGLEHKVVKDALYYGLGALLKGRVS